ncbi:MAG: hypothetical protein F4X64_06295 [Chloroflexi bacterium]|nr:hypothetical protein [Chloroflexota bacterium]
MASIIVSGLSEESLERLEKRATIYGRSVEDEALHILKRAIGPDQEEREARMKEAAEELARLRKKVSQQQQERGVKADDKPGWLIIREDRDSDHGRLYDPWGLDDPGK